LPWFPGTRLAAESPEPTLWDLQQATALGMATHHDYSPQCRASVAWPAEPNNGTPSILPIPSSAGQIVSPLQAA